MKGDHQIAVHRDYAKIMSAVAVVLVSLAIVAGWIGAPVAVLILVFLAIVCGIDAFFENAKARRLLRQQQRQHRQKMLHACLAKRAEEAVERLKGYTCTDGECVEEAPKKPSLTDEEIRKLEKEVGL